MYNSALNANFIFISFYWEFIWLIIFAFAAFFLETILLEEYQKILASWQI